MPSATANGNQLRGFYLPTGLHARTKAAWWATRDVPDAAPTLASLVGQLMTTETDRLEQAHNGGAPFPPAPDGARGRTVTSGDQRNHSYFLPDAVYLRTKNAWWATRDLADGASSISSLVTKLMTAEASRLEGEFNDGQPFPPAPARARGVDPEASRRQGEVMASLWKAQRDRAEQA